MQQHLGYLNSLSYFHSYFLIFILRINIREEHSARVRVRSAKGNNQQFRKPNQKKKQNLIIILQKRNEMMMVSNDGGIKCASINTGTVVISMLNCSRESLIGL